MEGVWENFMRNNQDTFKSLFLRKKLSSIDEDSPAGTPTPIPPSLLSQIPLIFRCCKILKIPSEELQHRFDIELPESVKQLFTYARNFLEFCSYQALHKVSRNPDYLSDADFRRLTYDMMLAWEAPCAECERGTKETLPNNDEVEDDEDGSLFYSSPMSMAVQIIIDIEGGVPTQPVLQHIGISVWPGRLTLTSFSLYFEALGVGVYEKAVRYDLATDLEQVIKPELTGPLGARIFDKAVMYKSTTVTEPVHFEFPEFKGNFRRNFWLDISLEILHAHRFARKHNLKETQKSEVVARAILGIFRYHALREAFQFFSSRYKNLLSFNLAESLPGGDTILETLASRLALLNVDNSPRTVKHPPISSPFSHLALSQLGFIPQKNAILEGEALMVGDFCIGETHPLELAVKKSISDTGRAEAAQATVNQVKVEGIETNLSVMKELLFPFIQLATCLVLLSSWKEPFKSTVFLMLISLTIIRGNALGAFTIIAPSNQNAVEQLLTLQEVISQNEALIQTANVFLLKIRAIFFAVLPQATDRVAISLVFLAAVLAFVPSRFLILFVFLEAFTRELPYRRESTNRWLWRLREWWFRIPAAPVQLIRADDKKKKLHMVEIWLKHGFGKSSMELQMRLIERNSEIPHEGPFCDLMWSDPEDIETWAVSPRGAGWLFGARVTSEFNHINNLDLVCRAHQLVQEGLKYMFEDKGLVTVWSAPNYCYRCGNVASILSFNENMERKVEFFTETEENNQMRGPRTGVPYFL
ncbi:Serine/threonine-protein phosphatase 6 catalytic subunit [Hibiscus syriacus]|uniref:Serine/threonine-protein phosphatase 6 catalytic subunit n=1 Tax=Hibiscus syriacus TaxID=106335 RepID=A0A6A2Z4L2_HIBSY|nr:Serine/threonine-protein phosphatase 6 catalytic subunit [Hibiscus syriacus]